MQFRPCIDLHGGKVRQIIGSTFNLTSSLASNPDSVEDTLKVNFTAHKSSNYYASLYRQDNLKGGHIIKLGAGNEEAAEEALRAFPGGMQLGGGINAKNAKDWLNKGASHVIITSAIFSRGNLWMDKLLELVSICGSNRIVIDLSCAKQGGDYVVMTDGWRLPSDEKIKESLFDKLAPFCDEFLIHAVDVEGKRQGMDKELVDILIRLKNYRIVYAGGIYQLDEIEYLRNQSEGRLNFTIGSSLDIFGGHLKYSEIAKLFK